MSRLTIDQLKAVQRDRGLLDVHLVSLDDDGFTIAHTDAERATGMDLLTDCGFHRWLADEGPLFEYSEGEWIVTPHEPDAYSEPYGAYPWDFDALAGFGDEREATQ